MNSFQSIEKKWQDAWESAKQFSQRGFGQKYYQLEMFPYPSGRIHMGHVRNYVLGDVIARFKHANGFDVLHPMGWDAFGLPAENAAIEHHILPQVWTKNNIQYMKDELRRLGLSIDWDREFSTCDPDYCRDEQMIFLSLLKHDLVYRKESMVNFDPIEHTILANEQVINGRGWRSGALVERRKIWGWFARITYFSKDLNHGLIHMKDWPEKVRLMQKNWIGLSEGVEFTVSLYHKNKKFFSDINIFTTKVETIYGMTFCALASEHPITLHFSKQDANVASFVEKMSHAPLDEEALSTMPKEGVLLPIIAKHPLENRFVPVFAVNFIISDYGTGAIFGCPSEDERDREFSEKYHLEVRAVMQGECFVHPDLHGLTRSEARAKLATIGCKKVVSRLRDWGISRQRYWGCPIPIIYCQSCGIVPVPEEELPVLLPEDIVFDGCGNPLDRHPTWKKTLCPQCHGDAERETDTLDTFFESSWYFLRFYTSREGGCLFRNISHLLPVDCYIGGIEHAVLHLLYARFFMLALRHIGYDVPILPFKKLFTQGMVCYPTFQDQDGNWISPEDATYVQHVKRGPSEKMSKSKKNIIEPERIFSKFGVDATRLFVLSDTPPERDFEWNESGIAGCYKFLKRIEFFAQSARFVDETDIEKRFVHSMIFSITTFFNNLHFNKAIASLRELFRFLSSGCSKNNFLQFLKMLAPFAPHLAEELWCFLGGEGFILRASWPIANPYYLNKEEVVVALQVNGKLRGTISVPVNISEDELRNRAIQHPRLQSFLEGRPIQRTIVINTKVVNFVV